ncbi:MAG TPA: hypothetical protein VF482_14600, partial [Trebonia sp.]
MNRRDSGPGRGTQARGPEAVYPDGPPDGDYPGAAYLDAGAYPVDPGYRAYASSRPRPGGAPAGPPPRPHSERPAPPPRGGVPPRPWPPRQPRDTSMYDRPWQRPED